MRKNTALFTVAAVAVILGTAVFIRLNRQERVPLREAPEFVIPESAAAPEEEPENSIITPCKPQASDSETAETAPGQLTDNILLSSCDPEHYIRFLFQPDVILYSGVYSGEGFSVVKVLKPRILSNDLSFSGSEFSGSIDISSLAEGYYILRFTTDSGSIMDYVFEVTEHGAQPLPMDRLPTESNLSVTVAPLEIPRDTVLKLITANGDMDRAAEVLQTVKAISDAVCEGISGELDKARALAQWTAENIYYDLDAKENGVTDDMLTLEYVLENHRSVCYGWTNLYSALCQAQGIDCLNVNGSVVTESRCFLQTQPADERAHSWNMLIIDGEKIWVDTVWNSSNDYEDGKYYRGNTDLQYFGITNAALAQDHRAVRCERRDYFGAVG